MAYQNARRSCIAKMITSVKKVMHAIVFTSNGLAIQVSIPKGKSMNKRFYRRNVFRKLIKFYQKCWPKIGICGIYLLHSNASSHKAESVTLSFLKRTRDLRSRTSPYSPDLVPCDFFLFPCHKKNPTDRNIPPSKSKVSPYLSSL